MGSRGWGARRVSVSNLIRVVGALLAAAADAAAAALGKYTSRADCFPLRMELFTGCV